QKDCPTRVGALALGVLLPLARAVDGGGGEVLAVLPRLLRTFDLHDPDSPLREELRPLLEVLKAEHLPLWRQRAGHDPHFRRRLWHAQADGLRALLTGAHRAVPTRYSFRGIVLH